MARSQPYPGPPGKCSGCNHASWLRVGSMDKRHWKPWVVDEALITKVADDIKALTSARNGAAVRCKNSWECTKYLVKKLLWVTPYGEVGKMPEKLYGPFCSICWDELRPEWGEKSREVEPLVYFVWLKSEKTLEQLMHTEHRATPLVVNIDELF